MSSATVDVAMSWACDHNRRVEHHLHQTPGFQNAYELLAAFLEDMEVALEHNGSTPVVIETLLEDVAKSMLKKMVAGADQAEQDRAAALRLMESAPGAKLLTAERLREMGVLPEQDS